MDSKRSSGGEDAYSLFFSLMIHSLQSFIDIYYLGKKKKNPLIFV